MSVQKIKGIAADETYVILNGVKSISPVSYYTQIYKDEKGKKIKKRHSFFEISWGNESIRFERKRKDHIKPKRNTNNPHVLEIYIDENIADFRSRLVTNI